MRLEKTKREIMRSALPDEDKEQIVRDIDKQTAIARKESTAVFVWSENWKSFYLFQLCDTQWRIAGFSGVRYGLDNTALESTLNMMQIPNDERPEIYLDIKIMEREAANVFAEKAEAASNADT